tara:strand:- start:1497 stop:1844 length:348 start_codon:yes stop_codon:yes gene_type:complete
MIYLEKEELGCKEKIMSKKYSLKEIQRWLRNLEENKWRKRYAVDAKRIHHFVNLGEDIDLPISLRRRSESATYGKEKTLAKEFKRWIRNQNKINEIKKIIRNTVISEIIKNRGEI